MPSANTSVALAAELTATHFGRTGTVRALPGELDLNFRLDTPEGDTFLLKLAHAGEDRIHLELQAAMMIHLAAHPPEGFAVPQVIPDRQGALITPVPDPDGGTRYLRMISWVPGRVLAEVNPHPDSLLESIGDACGQLCHRLADFDHPGAHRRLKWDVAHTDWVAEHLHRIADPHRQAIARHFHRRFLEEVLPQLPRLRQSVIYHDANDYNVLVSPDLARPTVCGIIDLGDAVHTCTVADLAVAIAYAAMHKPDPLDAAVAVVGGFHRRYPLTEQEVALLYDLVAARLLISVTAATLNRLHHPDNEYLLISEKPAWDLLDRWFATAPAFAHFRFRAACGWEPCPQRPAFDRWFTHHAADLHPVVTLPADEVRTIDLGIGSLDLGHNGQFADVRNFSRTIDRMIEDQDGSFGVGGYGEYRPCYEADRFQVRTNHGPAWRTLHLGVDVWAPPGTPVRAPLDGQVHSVQLNAGDGNYGPTLLLAHPVSEELTFFTLYGHLDPDVLDRRPPGTPVRRGETLATIGRPPSNGNWPPHLHFQVVLDLLGHRGDFPGLAIPKERDTWCSLCPGIDPLQPARPLPPGPPAAAATGQLLLRRRQHLGPSLSLSYRSPLHILRGYRQFLYGADGRRYLDTVNNVPHVGHQHPRVVRAAQRQLAVLNTNTRYLHPTILQYAEDLLATLPPALSTVYFVNSGSEANELALRMARTLTGRQDFLAMEMGYHGNTGACVDISSYKFDRKGGLGKPPHTHLLPMPDLFRGPFRDPATAGGLYAAAADPLIDALQAEGRQPAAFIAESVLSCGGQIPLPTGFLAEVYQRVRAAGGLCIADEVQTGLGRVGSHWWGFETQGVVPDIVTMGKPLGNGHPLAALATTPDIARAFANGMEYFNTFGGNPVSCTIGREVLRVVHEEGLREQADRTGRLLTGFLLELHRDFPLIGDVRGPGLFLGFELVLDPTDRTPATRQAAWLANRMRDLGILMSTDGPDENVLKIKPPLCFGPGDAERLAETLATVLREDALQPDAWPIPPA